ncbi:MAG TPA: aminoglycoside phosphotransferase [Nitrospiraceae bacterium]|nr:aminoglycoside phosphotransferase [Nitrospiraceae bacterium]
MREEMIEKGNLEKYLKGLFGEEITLKEFSQLGEGVHGTGFSIVLDTEAGIKRLVLKDLAGEGLGHDLPSDRASVFLWAKDNYRLLPKHIKAVDVAMLTEAGAVQSIGTGKEYYLLMEEAKGINYFTDLDSMAVKDSLDESDKKKIYMMSDYLSEIHKVKKESRILYWRKLRDTIGHGECLMGVFDTYPDGTIDYEEMAEIEKKCIDWRAKLKPEFKRLCQIHGDFHPGNIWFKDSEDFILLDRSRGPWGDAADDITALTINYIFFSINKFGRLYGPYSEALKLFYDRYIRSSGDSGLYSVVAPFYAFRGVVVANPVFYPAVTHKNRRRIFNFIHSVLEDRDFSPDRVNDYIEAR